MVGHATYFNGDTPEVSDDATNVCKNAVKIIIPHGDSCVFSVEYQMNIYFYQCTCHIVF